MIGVFDAEANGLLDTVSVLHCLSLKDYERGRLVSFDSRSPLYTDDIIWHLEQCDALIGHNIIKYDLPLLKKLLGFEYKGEVYDTFLMSMMENPDRKRHPNCPSHHPARAGEKRRAIGPHSLENWGYVVGRGKVEYHAWDTFDEGMLHRCDEDVEITDLVFKYLNDRMEVL